MKLIPGCGVGILQVDDDLLRQQQEAYKMKGVDETEVVSAQQLKKKRKQQAMAEEVGKAVWTKV